MRHANAVMAVLCLNLIITACSDFYAESKKNEIAPPSVFVIKSQELSGLVQASVSPTPKPERYIVYLSWPKFEANKKLRLRVGQFQSIINSEINTFSHEVSHNQTLNYTFDILDENLKTEKTFSKPVKIPQDFMVSEENNNITENSKIIAERVFLSKRVPLITNGHHVEIITNSLYSDNGVIQSFPVNQKANLNENGRSGGELFIKANSASGKLNIMMRGEHGGDGSNGVAYAGRALDGAPPEIGEVECDFSGKGDFDILNMKCICLKKGKDGQNAMNGLPGMSGGNAGSGGNTGSLKIEINDGTNFFLETAKEIGRAGHPGLGGPGQEGGIALGSESNCSGRKGQNGKAGSPGPIGMSAENGKEEITCITIITENKNDCF